jgi:hypothetical protein
VEWVCVAATGDHEPGNVVVVNDGAAVSPFHFAAPGAPEALAAVSGRGAVTHAKPPAAGPTPASTEGSEAPGAAQPAAPMPVLAPPGSSQ